MAHFEKNENIYLIFALIGTRIHIFLTRDHSARSVQDIGTREVNVFA